MKKAVAQVDRLPPIKPLTIAQARSMQLAAQGLLQLPKRRAKREDVSACIAQMRLLQIDTIHVIARSPYTVLFARVGDYRREWLDETLALGDIAECWAHEACFVPASDIPLHRAWRSQRHMHWAQRHALRIRAEYSMQMDQLLERIRVSGPVRAADFERTDQGVSGWWQWKPEKRWLEAWFALGDLMVTQRDKFQRVYDLAERVLAKRASRQDDADADLAHASLRERFILDSVRALGITPARWIADYYRLKPSVNDRELAPLVERGLLLKVGVIDWETPAYVHADHAELLEKAGGGRLRATHTALLSPFDPLVWDRARLRGMFDFDYAIECYTPAAKRRFGYYVLPILHRDRLIGRLDAKAHRVEGIFEIKSLFLEPDVEPDERLISNVAEAISAMARWHDTPRIKMTRCRPASLGSALRAHWRAV